MFQEILPNLFVIFPPDSGSNSYLLVGKKTALIDSGLGKNPRDWRELLHLKGLMRESIDFVILHTHAHADHFLGDKLFSNAQIFWPEIDARPIELRDEEFTYLHFFNANFYEKFDQKTHHKGADNFFPPVHKKLKENEVIDFSPFNLQVIQTPGHTIGSVCFFDKKLKLLFSGDTLFNGSIGRFDLISGSKQQLFESIQKLKDLDFDFLLPGHGALLKGSQKENFEQAINLLNPDNM